MIWPHFGRVLCLAVVFSPLTACKSEKPVQSKSAPTRSVFVTESVIATAKSSLQSAQIRQDFFTLWAQIHSKIFKSFPQFHLGESPAVALGLSLYSIRLLDQAETLRSN